MANEGPLPDESTAAFILRIIKDRGLTQREVALSARVNPGQFNNFLRMGGPLSEKRVDAILKALDLGHQAQGVLAAGRLLGRLQMLLNGYRDASSPLAEFEDAVSIAKRCGLAKVPYHLPAALAETKSLAGRELGHPDLFFTPAGLRFAAECAEKEGLKILTPGLAIAFQNGMGEKPQTSGGASAPSISSETPVVADVVVPVGTVRLDEGQGMQYEQVGEAWGLVSADTKPCSCLRVTVSTLHGAPLGEGYITQYYSLNDAEGGMTRVSVAKSIEGRRWQ